MNGNKHNVMVVPNPFFGIMFVNYAKNFSGGSDETLRSFHLNNMVAAPLANSKNRRKHTT